jgi:diacylglycerol O-acyltransferase
MIETPQPKQLADGDSIFVSVESREAPSHIAGLALLDPSTSSSFSFDRYLKTLAERIELVPRFKWKLKEIPLGLDRAYWVEDSDFDAREHVQRVAVPQPGDRAALARLAGYLHEQPLDRSRPLWESWWIEGIERDRVAILLKIHHSLMDGQSGIGLTEVLMDLKPEPGRRPAPSKDMLEPPPRSPKVWEIAQRAVENGFRRQSRLANHTGRAARDLLKNLWEISEGPPAPKTSHASFNRRLSRHREFAFATLPLAPLRDAKKHFGVKMNDVLLEIVSSSLRRGLEKTDELPDKSLVALCPVSLREPGDQSFGNQITSMAVSLATHLPDPCARLKAICFSAEQAKRRAREGAFEILTALGESLPPAALQLITKTLHKASNQVPLPANLVFSNVRGLPVATYMAGARVEELYPMSMLQVANGMNVTAVTHDDQVDFGFLVDPNLIPDPWIFAEGVQSALEELENASEHLASRPDTRPDKANEPASGLPNPSESSSNSEEDPIDSPDRVGSETEIVLESAKEAEPLDMSLVMAGLNRPQIVRDGAV